MLPQRAVMGEEREMHMGGGRTVFSAVARRGRYWVGIGQVLGRHWAGIG